MKIQDPSMLYRLIVLYMLKSVDFQLTNSDICDYVLEKGYTDSMTLQIAISDLVNGNLIIPDKKNNRTYYSLSDEGEMTIDSLCDRLDDEVKKDIYVYLNSHARELRKDHSIQTAIEKNPDGSYLVKLDAYDGVSKLMGLSLNFPSKELANNACENFLSRCTKIYEYAISSLLEENE